MAQKAAASDLPEEINQIDALEVVEDVIDKLRDLLMADARNLNVWPRSINRQFMLANNFHLHEILQILRNLKIWQYGGTSKKEGCNDAYVFGVTDNGCDIYLKCQFNLSTEQVQVDVLSFHDPKWQLEYPYIAMKPKKRGKKDEA